MGQRVSHWLLEGQRMLRELDDVVRERDELRAKTAEIEQQNARLEREVRAALSELVAMHEKYHQLQVEHVGLTRAVSKLLSQMTTIVQPMKELAEKVGPLPSE